MFYIGRIYAIYEQIFSEDNRSINLFNQTMTAPDKLLPRLETLAQSCSSYKKYKSNLIELYSKLELMSEQAKNGTKLDFVAGYMSQQNKITKY